MNDHEDTLDALLSEHFARRLDPQLGRAQAHFAKTVSKRHELHAGRSGRLLIWGLWAAGAMAASVGIVWGMGVYHNPSQPHLAQQLEPTTDPSSAPQPQIPIAQVISYRTLDEGSVVLENQGPARQLRRQV